MAAASAGAGTSAGSSGGGGVSSGSAYGSLTEKELGEKLIESGTKLIDPPSAVDELLTQLDDLESNLSSVSQAPRQYLQDCLLPVMRALIANKLLRHTDTDVKASVAVCINEITRITAPDAPYNDDEMKECFQLTITTLEKLSHSSSRSYIKAITILETIARVRSCLMMLDLECDALVVEMFQLFLKIIRSNHPNPVVENMETIMTLLIKENEDICSNLLTTLLDSVKKENQNVLPMTLKLGEKVIKNCAAKLKPYFMDAIESVRIDVNDYVPLVSSICNNSSDELEPNHVIVREEQRVEVASGLSSDVHAEEACAGLKCSLDATYNKETEAFDSSVGTTQNKDDETLDGIIVDTRNIDKGLDGRIGATESNDHEVLGGKDAAQNNDNETSADKKPFKSLARCSESNPSESSEATQHQESEKREIVNSVKSKMEPERVLRKRGLKPNCSMNPDEGYEHYWMGGGTSEPKLRRNKNDKARVNQDSFSKSVSKEEKVLSTDDNVALVVVPEEPQTGTVGASPTASCSIPDEGLPKRRKNKGSIAAQQDAEISQSVTVTTEKSQSGSMVSSGKTESGSMVPLEQSRSVSTSTCTLPDSSIHKKKQSMVTQHDAETSQSEAVVSPPKTQSETDTILEKSPSGIVTPNSSLPDGIHPTKKSKKKESIMTQPDGKISQNVTIVLPEESQNGTISLNGGPPDASQLKRRKNKGSSMTGKDVDTSQTVIIILPKNSQSAAIDASSISEGSIPDGRLLKMKRKENGCGVTVRDADEYFPSAKKKRLVSTQVEDKAGPLEKQLESQLTSPKVSQTVITQSTSTPSCNKLPAEKSKKAGKSKKKSMETKENAVEDCSSVANEAAKIPEGNIPGILKMKRKEKGSSATLQDEDKDSPSAKKKRLISTIEDKLAGPVLQKYAESQLTSPEVSQTVITQSKPTPNCNKLPAEKSKKTGHLKKKSTVTQPTADEKYPSVPEEGPSSPRVHCEPTHDAKAINKTKHIDTETLGQKQKKSSPHSQKKADSGKTMVETALAPQDAAFKEGGQSDHEEKPVIQPIMNESPKSTCGKGSSAPVKRGRPKKTATEKIIGNSTPSSSIKSNLDNSLKKETKRKLTPANKVPRKPCTAEEARGLVGKQIKIWWPRDKTFYDGIVVEYDYFKEKHRILYTDGVEEVLNLRTQVWELIEEDNKTPTEQALEVNTANRDQASTDMMETPPANPEDQSTTMMANLNTTETHNTKEIPDSNAPESCGLETLSKVAEKQSSSKKSGKKRGEGVAI